MRQRSALESFDEGLRLVAARPSDRSDLRVVTDAGEELALPLERYVGDPTPADTSVIDRAIGPVLDVGCGPGRHLLGLRRRGVPALGIDVSPFAVRLARRRGLKVIRASVFDQLPDEGRWATVLLLDGNIGIGGSPRDLLLRISALLRPTGQTLIEIEPCSAGATTARLRFETPGVISNWFPWGRVGADDLMTLATCAGFRVTEAWQRCGRRFAALTRD